MKDVPIVPSECSILTDVPDTVFHNDFIGAYKDIMTYVITNFDFSGHDRINIGHAILVKNKKNLHKYQLLPLIKLLADFDMLSREKIAGESWVLERIIKDINPQRQRCSFKFWRKMLPMVIPHIEWVLDYLKIHDGSQAPVICEHLATAAEDDPDLFIKYGTIRKIAMSRKHFSYACCLTTECDKPCPYLMCTSRWIEWLDTLKEELDRLTGIPQAVIKHGIMTYLQ